MSTGFQNLGSAQFKITLDDKQFERQLKKLEKDVDKWHSTFDKGFKDAESTVKKTSRGMGQGLLQVGYAIDDLQYGFRSVVNNIPQMVYMMGGSAGIAGAAAITAVAVNQLSEHWGTMVNMFQSIWSGTPLSELEKIRLKAEQTGEAFEKLSKVPTKMAAGMAKSMSDLIENEGVDKIAGAVKGAIGIDSVMGTKPKKLPGIDDETTPAERFASIMGMVPARQVPEKRLGMQKKAQAEADKANEKATKELLGAAALGEEKAMRTLAGLAKRHPNNFPEGFRTSIEAMLAKPGEKILPGESVESQREKQAKLESEGRKNVDRFEEAHAVKEETTARRIANAQLGLNVLAGGGIKGSDVERVMKAGGINTGKGGQRPEQVRKQLMKDLDEEIKAKMLETGANRAQARAMVTAEHYQRLLGHRENKPGEFVGISEFAKKIQMGALNRGPDQILKMQLQVLQDIRTNLARRAVGLPPIARAGAPG